MNRTSSEISGMFSGISRRYDLANRILSFGLDKSWRKRLIQSAVPLKGDRVLDLCTGTADLVCAFSRHQQELEVLGLDLSRGMLEVGIKKVASEKSSSDALLIEADALVLPFGTGQFDIISIAFGLRNLVDRPAGLAEMARVLDSGGRLLILEFSLPQFRPWRLIYLSYLKYVLPILGGLLTGSRSSYSYLHESICEFPEPKAICSMIADAGFVNVQRRSLLGGVAILYSSTKP